MDRQVTLRIPASLAARLADAAKSTRRRRSEIVRMALEEYLEVSGRTAVRPIDLVRDLVGSVDTGIPDLGERHREHLIRIFRRGRAADT
jgi:hypothetical protein